MLYLRRLRLERPPIGTFNARDIGILSCFLVTLPLLYVVLPQWGLTAFLILTFTGSLSIGYRPLLGRGKLWFGIGLLIGLNIWMTRTLLGTVLGWQIYWVENSVIVMLGAVAVANLYVQGGMRLKHVAWFALGLACYDVVFTLKWPITNKLAERFLGFPLDPSVAFRMGVYNASIGIGDLLVYAVFVLAAYKAYGRRPAGSRWRSPPCSARRCRPWRRWRPRRSSTPAPTSSCRRRRSSARWRSCVTTGCGTAGDRSGP